MNFDFTNTYFMLAGKYGESAATTYNWNRLMGKTAWYSFLAMKSQIDELGTKYAGGLSCTKYRH